MRRAANRQSSIYLGKDGYWHGRVTVGRKDDGSLDRRHVMSKSKATVITKVRALERLRDELRVPKVGRAWTVEKWLLHWLEEISRPNIRDVVPGSVATLAVTVDRHRPPPPNRLIELILRHWTGRVDTPSRGDLRWISFSISLSIKSSSQKDDCR